MSKAFDTINIRTLIRKLLQTNIPGTILKLIANYIKGSKAYTTYRNHTSRQRQFKTRVPQGVLSPTLFNIYTSDLLQPSAPVQVMAYVDDITITSTHTSTQSSITSHHIPTGHHRLHEEAVPAEILNVMNRRDDLRKRDPTSPELPRMNKTIQNHICVHKRQIWRDFVETMDQKTRDPY